MASGDLPFKKRSNPFNDPVVPTTESVVKAPEVVVVEKNETKKVAKVQEDNNREKYTATMEKTLRTRVKIASVKNGIQFSTFIEQACLEKLEREGM